MFCRLYSILRASIEHVLQLMPENISLAFSRATTPGCDGLWDAASVVFAAFRTFYPRDLFLLLSIGAFGFDSACIEKVLILPPYP